MDIASTAISSALRVGIQIASTMKRPCVEFYCQFRNVIEPEQEYLGPDPGGSGLVPRRQLRIRESYLAFTAINIGTQRAEDVSLKLDGELRRNPPREDFGPKFDNEIPHMAPGQSWFLFRFDIHDLTRYEQREGYRAGVGDKTEHLEIAAEYNGPRSGLNVVGRWWCDLRGRKQYRSVYRFVPDTVRGDLPPVEYA